MPERLYRERETHDSTKYLSLFCSQPARLRVWAHRWSLTALLCSVLSCPVLLYSDLVWSGLICSALVCPLVLLTVLCCDVLSVRTYTAALVQRLPPSLRPLCQANPAMQAAAIPGPKIKSSVPTLTLPAGLMGQRHPLKSPTQSPRAKLHGPNSTAQSSQRPLALPFHSSSSDSSSHAHPTSDTPIYNANHTRRSTCHPSFMSLRHPR